MGSQQHSQDFDGQIETSRWNFTEAVLSIRQALNDLLARNLIVKFPGIKKISHWRASGLEGQVCVTLQTSSRELGIGAK